MSKILLLGSNHPSTALAYKKFGLPESVLVDSLNQDWEVGHTARQEFNNDEDFAQLLSTADKIYWTSPSIEEFGDKVVYYEFLEWLKNYNDGRGNIENFYDIDPDPYDWRSEPLSLREKDAVFFGCSFTQGIGLPDTKTRWANIVSAHFGKNCVNLGKSGTSNSYAFDLISNTNFVPGQIVVWQLTHLDRLRYCSQTREPEDIILANTKHCKNRSMVDVFTLEYLMLDLVSKIEMVVRLCRALDLRLVIWLIDYKERSTFSLEDQMYFYRYPEFISSAMLQDYMVDVGDDNLHPGIMSNQIIAQAVVSHMERLYK